MLLFRAIMIISPERRLPTPRPSATRATAAIHRAILARADGKQASRQAARHYRPANSMLALSRGSDRGRVPCSLGDLGPRTKIGTAREKVAGFSPESSERPIRSGHVRRRQRSCR